MSKDSSQSEWFALPGCESVDDANATPIPTSDASSVAPLARAHWVVRVAALVVLALAASWAFHGVDWGALRHALSDARPWWILLAALTNLAAVYAMAGRWLAVLRPLTPAATWADAFRAMIVGFTVSAVVPARAGELARAECIRRCTGLSRVSGMGSILLDHMVNAVGMFTGIALLPFFFEIPAWLKPGVVLAAVVFSAATVAIAVLRPRRHGAPAAGSHPPRGALGTAWQRFVSHARAGVCAVRDRRALGLSFALSLVAWAIEIHVILFVLSAFHLQLPLAASFLILMAVNLALVVPFAPPANLGMIEVAAMLALMEFGVTKEQALAFALTYHAVMVIPVVLTAMCCGGLAVLAPRPARASS